LVVDSNDASRQALSELLRSAGYEVAESASQTEGFDFVRNTGVDLLLLTADLSDIQCCDALAEVKGNASTASTRVVLITRGGAAERARGPRPRCGRYSLPALGTCRTAGGVRVQLKERHAFDELAEKTRIADEGREMAQTAFQALAGNRKMTRDAFSLERALENRRIGSLYHRYRDCGDFSPLFAAGEQRSEPRVFRHRAAGARRSPPGTVGSGNPQRRAPISSTRMFFSKSSSSSSNRKSCARKSRVHRPMTSLRCGNSLTKRPTVFGASKRNRRLPRT